jgi:hypothetical protein
MFIVARPPSFHNPVEVECSARSSQCRSLRSSDFDVRLVTINIAPPTGLPSGTLDHRFELPMTQVRLLVTSYVVRVPCARWRVAGKGD